MAARLVTDLASLDRMVAALRAGGRPVVRDVAAATVGTVYVAAVADHDDAANAVLAALAGADVVLACTGPDEVVDPLTDDLARLGPVEHDMSVPLGHDQLELLAHLRSGRTLGAAAAALHLSRRTADRRLAQARAALGVRTTAEALVAATRLGLLADQ